MDAVIDAIVEIFTWVGLGAGILLAVVALIMLAADGEWLPVRVVLEETDTGRVARWFDGDGGVNESALTHEQAVALEGKSMADAFARVGVAHRMRLTRGSHAVRFVGWLAAALLAIGALAGALSLVLLFVRG